MGDSNRVLRHHIRNCMFGYAMYHQESELALRGMAVTLVNLTGQPGISPEERADRVAKAHEAIVEVFVADEYNQLLIEAHAAIHALMTMIGVDIPENPEAKSPEPNPEIDTILAKYEEEFDNTKE